ncbi:putative uroporphyrin-III c-methyltransferase [Lactiplantibacillus plantarum]|nr:putative uroporphyrin-III c-methyltransferase [Lactiplantibacillus plantarum]
MMQLKLERIYTKPVDTDGYRLLVDRLWPRGISKVNAQLDDWVKEIGPSTTLRKWFNHEPAKYPEFVTRYRAELDENPLTASFISQVAEQLTKTNVILLFGAKDEQHNQAVVLRDYLKDSGKLPTA